MLLNPLTFHSPQSLEEAINLYSGLAEARLLAGGTFLLNSLKLLKRRGIKTPQNIISLKRVPELKGVSVTEEALTVGSMTIINDLFDSPHLKDNFSVLRTVCRNISTNPIRNMATVGGNLTSRYTWTELGAPLIALETKMHFVGANNVTEDITVEEFFNNAAKTSKILKCLTIKRDKTASIAYQRVKKLSDVDVPLLGVCIKTNFINGRFTNTRAAINSGTFFAKRDLILEEFLNRSHAKENIAKEALDHLDTSIYDTRSDDYKKQMFRVSIKNAIQDLIQRSTSKRP